MAADVIPIFVVGLPGSGVMLAGEALEASPGFWTHMSAGQDLLEGLNRSFPDGRGDRLIPGDAIDAETAHRRLTLQLRDHLDRAPDWDQGAAITVVDASVYHALRISFLAETFPAARFLVIDRPAVEAVSSSLEAWRSQRRVSHPELPGWTKPRWTYPLVPGWQDLKGLPAEQIAIRQWISMAEHLRQDLSSIDPARWTLLRYEDLCQAPAAALREAMHRLHLALDPAPPHPLALARTTLSPPRPDKWRDLNPGLPSLLAAFADQIGRWEAFVGRVPSPLVAESASTVPHQGPSRGSAVSHAEPTGSHDEVTFQVKGDFADVLASNGVSLIASTYRSGHVISFGAPNGALTWSSLQLNAPMGMAVHEDLLTVGTFGDVMTFRNDPAASRAVGAPCDACYLPKTIRLTGEMGVREVAYVGNELWAVSSKFSCLVRLATDYSFEPRWFPPFISRLANDDRCHLNGIAVRDQSIAYVTALGETDSAEGWRADKAAGGVVVDLATGATVTRGLSMPHSPRWYRDRLWVLESGKGDLVICDPRTGDKETVAHVPGFARGLAFIGDYAVIGLSDIRESVFRGLPIVDEPDRHCGIWIVDLRNGTPVGTIRFEGIIQELFDVIVVPTARYPVLPSLDSGLNKTSFMVPSTSRMPTRGSA